MLEKAPVDRAWRRRGWLVMLRSHKGASGGGNTVQKVDTVFGVVVTSLTQLVPDGVFRSVVSFL